MDKNVEKYLYDALESIHIIETHLVNIKIFSAFSQNLLVKDAIQRRLSIIGEALWKADKLNTSINITNIRKIISFRHVLIHDYDKIEMPSVWIIVTKDLNILKGEIEIILKKTDGSSIN